MDATSELSSNKCWFIEMFQQFLIKLLCIIVNLADIKLRFPYKIVADIILSVKALLHEQFFISDTHCTHMRIYLANVFACIHFVLRLGLAFSNKNSSL